jgi:glyoxylase-like metal-dependent hydrolase (beta-lactamase superfamily II)
MRPVARSAPWTVAVGVLALVAAAAADEPHEFVAEQLAEGVFLLQPRSQSTAWTNSLVVVRDEGPLVIDAQPSPEAARELLAAVATIDPRPIRFLVLSHPHAESTGGATAFPANTVVVASGGCARLLADPNYDTGAELRAAAAPPDTWIAPPRRLPVVVADGPLTLTDPERAVEIYPVGSAHSPGDVIIQLPKSSITYVGALVAMDGNPHPGDGDTRGWLDALHQISRAGSETIIPLRGPRATRADAVRFREGLAWLRGQVETGLRQGVPWEDIPNFVVQSYRFSEYYSPGATPPFHALLVEKVLREADDERTKRTLPSIAPR